MLKSLLPWRAGGPGGWEAVAAERSFSPLQLRPFRWRWLRLHGRRKPPRPLLPGRGRGKERSARTQAPAAPGLAGAWAAAAGGAHVGCRALARCLGQGRIPSRSHSPRMWGCDCYSTFRRRVSALPLALRLALSPAWPRGMPPGRSADVTAMLCTSPPPPPPLYTSSVCGAHLLLAKGACAAGRPDSSQSAPPLRLRPPLPPRCVCTTAEARRANAGSPGLGVEIKQTMTFPFPSRLSQVKTHLKTTSVVSDPAHPGQ